MAKPLKIERFCVSAQTDVLFQGTILLHRIQRYYFFIYLSGLVSTMDAIVIEGLKVDTVVGCFNWERQIIQPLLLDLEISNCLLAASESDELDDTLNYAEICEISSQVIRQAAPKLIEHAAKLVIDALFTTYPSIESIKITIRKPAIIAQANSVGIRLERHRHHLRACSRE